MAHPIYRITRFTRVAPYTLRIGFDDDSEQTIDFRPVLEGEVFGALRDEALFDRVQTGHRSTYASHKTERVNTRLVSVHRGHTAEFGNGRDSLAEVAAEYARQNFEWVAITEHIPPVSE